MAVVWNWWAMPSVVVFFAAVAMAGFVHFARPEGVANRRLALQLFLESFVLFVLSGGVWIFDDPRLVWALTGAATFLVWPKLWTYYNFLTTLPTTLVRPFRNPVFRYSFLALTLTAGMSWFIWPDFFYAGVAPTPFAAYVAVPGRGFFTMMHVWAVMWLVGLTFSISALRQARTPTARSQAKAYLIAFGTRDILFLLATIALTFTPPTSPFFLPLFVAIPCIWLVYIPLVGWGILRTQLFGIETKVKFAVKHSTLAGVAFAIFIITVEFLEGILTARTGTVVSLLIALGLTYMMKPVQLVADRLSDRAVPGVTADEAYWESRPVAIYRAAVEGALEDGNLTGTEEAMLTRLRQELKIDARMAGRIRKEVQRLLEAPASGPAGVVA